MKRAGVTALALGVALTPCLLASRASAGLATFFIAAVAGVSLSGSI